MDDSFAISDGPQLKAPALSRAVASAAAPLWVQPLGMRAMTLADAEADSAGAQDPAAWIVAIAVQSDRQCFALLFSHFAPRVKSYLLKLGCRPDQAEELAQETLLAVWRKAAYYDPSRASASTWIFTIARNQRIDALRRERHPEDLAGEPEMIPDAPAPADEAISAGEREARIQSAILCLSEEQAEVVRQSFFQDKAHGEISQDLGLPLGTVKSRLRLAMVRLRAQLEDLL
jgi:RNA polymerase sigma-70 factor (ECF subfamily)